MVDTRSCRVIFGEADFFPGLVIDKFSDVLVVQSLALGIDRYKEMIIELLKKVLKKMVSRSVAYTREVMPRFVARRGWNL